MTTGEVRPPHPARETACRCGQPADVAVLYDVIEMPTATTWRPGSWPAMEWVDWCLDCLADLAAGRPPSRFTVDLTNYVERRVAR